MADTNLPVTPGSGTNVDGYSLDNGNFRQSIIIGDPTTASKVSPVDSIEGLTSSARRDIPSNRARLILSADAQASVSAEAMMNFQSNKGGVVVTGISSYTVTAGKTLRIQSIAVKIRPSTPSTTVTFANTVLRLREGSTITSPLVMSFAVLMQTNVDSNPTIQHFADGLEFPSGTVLGISHLASAATILEGFNIVGYEY